MRSGFAAVVVALLVSLPLHSVALPPGLLAPLSDGAAPVLPLGEDIDAGVPSPRAFLGHALGERFVHHEPLLAYLGALAESTDRVAKWTYGTTYEGRPLTLVAISSAANIAALEEIRRRHLRLADPNGFEADEEERLLETTPVVVWLGYGVHGNEASSTEAALATAYLLAADQGKAAALLEHMIVLIDPVSNPDGRERYLHAFEQRLGREPNPDPVALEHREPWPGGRANHYLIDLNRDWAWTTQRETRDRLAAYLEWEPQVHVDLHEMSSRSSYFFPPAADPIHPLIEDRNLAWLDTFGRANAGAFDRNGWVYYNAENFDLFYPGYGDSYPFLCGAVGMTYEMAGGGRAGQALRLPDGRILSLADRIARHLTASLATIATAGAHHRELLADFVAARRAAWREDAITYLWEADQPEAYELAALLGRHGIRVDRLRRGAELEVASLLRAETAGRQRRSFAAGDFAVSSRQPRGALVRALLAPKVEMPEAFLDKQRERVEQGLNPEFYDITGWSLPLAYNLEAWRLQGEPPEPGTFLPAAASGSLLGEGSLGYLLAPRGVASYRAAARLQREGIRFRLALARMEISGVDYPPGTLFIPQRGNREDLEQVLRELAEETGLEPHRVGTSYRGEGVSLGSNRVVPIRVARVALLTGDGFETGSVGSLWHLLDREVELDHTRVGLEDLEEEDLARFDVVVLPSGKNLERRIDEKTTAALQRWLEAGGTLVAIGGSVEWLQEKKLTAIRSWKPEGEAESRDGRGAQVLDRLPLYTPGAVVVTEMVSGHPLTAGLPAAPPVNVRGTQVLLATGSPQQDVVKVVAQSPVVSGFAWPEAAERLAGSLLVGAEPHGAGQVVVFAQDPAFRLFWRGTMPLFLNAVMYGPSLADDERY